MVLDALLKIKNEQDPSLTFRRCARISRARARVRAPRPARAIASPPPHAFLFLRAQLLPRGHLRQLRDEH